MLYNINEKATQNMVMCLNCPSFNQETKHCEGLNQVCFEYDEKTKTCIDGLTGLPLIAQGE